MTFFSGYSCYSSPVAGLFWRSRSGGMQAVPVYTSAKLCVPAGLRSAWSGGLKPRNLASNHGEGFRPARVKQVHGNPKMFFFSFPDFSSSLLVAAQFLKCRSGPQKARQKPRNNTSASSFSLCGIHERWMLLRVRERAFGRV